jgi:transglutaminase-like putative cysteine protease
MNIIKLLSVVIAGSCLIVAIGRAEPALRDPAAVLAEASAVTRERFPDADTVLTYNLVHEQYNPDGTGESWDDEYVTILTEKGRREVGSRSIPFNVSYGTVSVVRAEIYKPSGRVIPVDVARQSRVMIESGQMGSNIFDPNNKVLSLSIPGLEVGDTCRFLTRSTTHKARVPNAWSDFSVLEYTSPILALDHEVVSPPGLPLVHQVLRASVSNTVAATTETLADGRIRHRWAVRNVPRMFEEPDMPPTHTQVQRLLLSTQADWPTVSRWYWNLSKPRIETTVPEMTATVGRLTAGADSRTERIRRIFTFVSQQIRYMGITDEAVAPGYEPHDVSMTFTNRYGVCRDKAALLVALLRLNGIEAFPVLIHAGAKLDPDVPLPFFNHAIVAAAREPADAANPYILMDPTDENTRDMLPSYLCNRSYLVATPAGDPLRVSPVVPAASNLLHIASEGEADAAGTLTLRSELRFDGINDTTYRNHLVRMPPDERRTFFEGVIKARLSGAELLDCALLPEDLRDTAQPLTVRLTCRVINWPVRGDGIDLASLPWLGASLGYVNFVVGQTGLPERKYTFETGVACGVEETVSIRVRDALGTPLRIPEATRLARPGVHFSLVTTAGDGRLGGTLNYRIEQPEFTPAEYLGLRASLQEMEVASRRRPAFAATGGSARPDVRVLDVLTRYDLVDSHAWTCTETHVTQVLTYAGKKKCSELMIGYNPAWQTAELVSATVSNANGTVFSVNGKEINRMDAPWVGGAPRYPAAKTLVVNLPGVETGSVITAVTRVTQCDAPRFTIQTVFGGFDPVTRETIEIAAPADLALDTRTFHAESLVETTDAEAGRTVRRWVAGPQAAIIREPGLPPGWTFKPTLLAAAGASDAGLAETRAAFARAMRGQTAAAAQARILAHEAGSPDAALLAIRDFVLRTIRPAGPAFMALPAGRAVSPADQTLAEGYGHSADRCILLATMLRAAGFDAEPVLVNPQRQRPLSLYSAARPFEGIAGFSEALVRVHRRPGLLARLFGRSTDAAPLYLGDGDQYSVLGTTAFEDHPLLMLDGRETRVETAPAFHARSRSDWHLALDADGAARITVTNWYFGPACGLFRRQYAEMPPEERRRHHLELVGGISRSAEAVGDLVTDLDAYPGFRAFTVRAARYAVRDGKALTLILPDVPSAAVPLRADRRFSPMLLGADGEHLWTCAVTLPVGLAAHIPVQPPAVALTLPGDAGSVTGASRIETAADGARTLRYERRIQNAPALLPPELYPALLEVNRTLLNPALRTVVIELD